MMEHSYFEDRLSAYFDGELAPPEMAAVKAHLQTCAECRSRIVELEKLQALVEKHGDLADGSYWEQNAEKVEARLGIAATSVTDIRPEKRSLSAWKWATAVASVVVLTFIGLHQSDILQDEPGARLPALDIETDSSSESQPLGEGVAEDLSDMPAELSQPSSPVPVDADGAPAGKTEREIMPRGERKGESEDVGRSEEPEALERRRELPSPVEEIQELNYRPPAKPEPESTRLEIGAGDRTGATIGEAQRSYTADKVELDSYRQVPVRDKKAVATDVFSPASGAVTNEYQAPEQSLGFWREMRDSALAVLRPRVEVRALHELTQADSTGKEHDSLVRSELNLLTACCEIARRSSDSIEVRQALDIVRGISENDSSPNRDMARGCLQRLGRSESRDSGNFED